MTRFAPTLRAVLAALFSIIPGLPSPAHAQAESASIRGSVIDPSDAVVQSALVRLIDIDRGSQTEVATGNAGFYTFASVRPGHYQIEVEKSGFKLVRLTGITVNVQDNLEHNFKLVVGPASEAITVIASAATINTTDGTVSTVVDTHFVDNLPMNGRTFQTLIMLAPGVVVTPVSTNDQGQFSVNGQRADANYFTVDGASANFGVTGALTLGQVAGGALPVLSAQGGTNSLVSVEAMQEFRVQTSSFAPEFGRTPGGQISIATRSGTNNFHGTLFEYFRNDVLDANNWFNGYTNNPPLAKAEERQNDFGAVFGGPIIKNRTFFLFSYEGLRLRQPSTQVTVVPDNSARLQAPTTIQPYLNAYPLPNGPELGLGTAQFSGSYSNPSSLNAYSIRVDHAINSNVSLFGRYDYSPSDSNIRAPFGSLSTTESLSTAVHTFTVGLTGTITPRMINELRANYSNQRVSSLFTLDSFGGAVPVPDSTLFPSGFTSANALYEYDIAGGGGVWATGKFATDEQRQVDLVDNLSWTKRTHALKFGVDYRWLSPFSSPLSYIQFALFGGVNSNPGGALSGTALFADVAALRDAALLTRNLSFYGQDTWKLSPRLTLTYGLRWEINLPLKGKNSQNQPYTVTGLNHPATMTLAPAGTPLYDTTYGNLAPRVGVAYQLGSAPDWGTVLRGGFGIFYDQGYGSLGVTSAFFPFNAAKIIAPSSCPNGNTGVCFPLSPQNASPPPFGTNFPIVTIVVPNPQLKLPRTYEWNVALEQSLGTSQSLSLTYIGADGRDLLRTTVLSNPNSDFINVDVTDNSATSNYQALQARFQRRLSQGLQALASYTWSHSIDIASTDAYNYLNTPSSVANPNIDRASSDFDIRHAFTAGITYNLPSPVWNNIAHAALGGWSVDGFIFARSAPPVNVTGGLVVEDGVQLYRRPNVVPGVPQTLYGSQYPGGKALNSTVIPGACPGGLNQVGAWCPVSSGQGDFPRNALRGFGAAQADLAFQRQFHLTERMQLRFRGEFFNIFNHPIFGPPDSTITDSLFGLSTATLNSSLGSGGANGGLNPLYQIGGPRSIQLALKLQF